MDRKVYINPRQYNIIKESEWNFHFGSNHDMRPHVSDNKFMMAGRETGHFGSGTYFATYKDSSEVDKLNDAKNMNPNFIQISDHLYRVDLDFYKNLYRVHSKRQGDILYTMMANLNHMFYKITEMGRFVSKNANYDNAGLYQEIKANADALNLDCPSYYQLTRMAQRHEGNQSFSTLFMEWNGYNGVNVSGVDYYDNTKHGSVIYDLSKVDTDMEEVSPNSLYTSEKDSSYDDTVAYDSLNNYRIAALRGKDLFWPSKLNDMPRNEALRILKNHLDSGNVLDPFTLEKLNDDLLSRYFRLMFSKDSSDRWGNRVCDEVLTGGSSKYYIELIEKVNGYYWVNYESRKSSGLIALLRSFNRNLDWGLDSSEEMKLKEEYFEKLKGYMSRPLNEKEEEYIKDDYFYD
jgi:hypothetical protein